MTRRLAVALAAVLTWLTVASVAFAHAELVSSIPARGANVSSAAARSIALTFSDALRSGSKADVVGSGGAVAATATIDPNNNRRLSWTSTTPLAPGTYTIRWTSIATDGDVLRGTIPFTVTAAPSPTAPTPSPSTASSPPTVVPSPPPSPDATSTQSAIGPVVAALVAVAVFGLVLLRRGRGRVG